MKTRRPTSSAAFIPKVEGRASSVEMSLPSARHATPDARHPADARSGMTMIELGVVMGIVTVLLALVLGLSRHVNEVVKIRRAQAELGEWHETFNAWFLQFGEYPYATIKVANNSVNDLLNKSNPSLNLSNLLESCYVQLTTSSGAPTNFTFRSFCTSGVSHLDPWGSPYIYDCDPLRKAYVLFSCGPDSRTVLNGVGVPTGTPLIPDPTLNDIYFER